MVFRVFTLFCDLDLPAAELGLLDVFDAEVAAARGVDLAFVPRRALVVRAVRIRRGCNQIVNSLHQFKR